MVSLRIAIGTLAFCGALRKLKFASLLPLFAMAVVLGALVTGADSGQAHSGNPHKSLHVDRWYQRYEDSYSYVTWMTLRGSVVYPSNFATTWQTPVVQAIGSYNDGSARGGQHTVYLTNYAPSSLDDVRTTVTNQLWCVGDIGLCVDTGNALGRTFFADEVTHDCPVGNCDANHSRPNTWWYALPALDNDAHTGFYDSSFQRQATAAHELGHAIGIAHDGLWDGNCGTGGIPETVMDNDCLDYEVLNVPQAWDSCGINHKYYDPNWGYSGC